MTEVYSPLNELNTKLTELDILSPQELGLQHLLSQRNDRIRVVKTPRQEREHRKDHVLVH